MCSIQIPGRRTLHICKSRESQHDRVHKRQNGILQEDYKRGHLKPGDTIVEATSGNTGIAFSAIGRALGHPVLIFMPDWMSSERINLIKGLGAQIRLVSKEEGGVMGVKIHNL